MVQRGLTLCLFNSTLCYTRKTDNISQKVKLFCTHSQNHVSAHSFQLDLTECIREFGEMNLL